VDAMDANAEATLPLPRFEDRLWDELVPLHPAAADADGAPSGHHGGPRRRYVAALVALAGAAAVLAVTLVVARDDRDRTRLGEHSTTTSTTSTTPAPGAADATVMVPEGLSLRQLVTRLTTGPDAVEGFTAEGLQQALADPGLRSHLLPADQPSLEGRLFPDTYELPADATEGDLVTRMVDRFDAVAGDLDLAGDAERLGRTPHEVLTVASVVEEETRFDDERARLARVLYNRLDLGMPLGVDATLCYVDGTDPCELSRDDLDSGSPYNTRRNKGLPPTPISSPGRASLDAALHPADGDWLYYVMTEADGHHRFVSTVEEFNEARNQAEAEGLVH
jgi:uncharacterized YceG family protein